MSIPFRPRQQPVVRDWIPAVALEQALAEISRAYPEAELAVNEVGNLSIVSGPGDSHPHVGMWNMRTGQVVWWEEQ